MEPLKVGTLFQILYYYESLSYSIEDVHCKLVKRQYYS